jgi:hypothetical protein
MKKKQDECCVLNLVCDNPNCTTRAVFCGKDYKEAKKQASSDGWFVIRMIKKEKEGFCLCPEHKSDGKSASTSTVQSKQASNVDWAKLSEEVESQLFRQTMMEELVKNKKKNWIAKQVDDEDGIVRQGYGNDDGDFIKMLRKMYVYKKPSNK